MAEIKPPTIDEVRKRATQKSFQRGEEYDRSGAIFDTVLRGNEIEGRCEGSEPVPYRVRAQLQNGHVFSASCTCEYTYGGDCKHIVALLLKFINAPQEFEERPPITDVLASYSKEDLIALIETMIAHKPDLEALVMPLPQPPDSHKRSAPNLEMYRRDLRKAFKDRDRYGYDRYDRYDDDYGSGSVTSAINRLTETAQRFANKADWHTAVALYSLILEECCVDDYDPGEDDGTLIETLDEVVNHLAECLKQPTLVEDDAERGAIFDKILDVYIWSMKAGGFDLAADLPDWLEQYAKPADVRPIRARIIEEAERSRTRAYSEFADNPYSEMLMILDEIEGVDPDVTIKNLMQQGSYQLAFNKLLDLKRLDEAMKLFHQYADDPFAQFQALYALAETGYRHVAIEQAERILATETSEQIESWLVQQYALQGNHEAAFTLQRQRFFRLPSLVEYRLLQQVAENFGNWPSARAKLLKELEKDKRFRMLLEIYMQEQDWDKAWQAWDQLADDPTTKGYDWRYTAQSLELQLAEEGAAASPHKAITILSKYARAEIDLRDREHYRQAAQYLLQVRKLYQSLNDTASWDKLITWTRNQFATLRALQDELNKVGL